MEIPSKTTVLYKIESNNFGPEVSDSWSKNEIHEAQKALQRLLADQICRLRPKEIVGRWNMLAGLALVRGRTDPNVKISKNISLFSQSHDC